MATSNQTRPEAVTPGLSSGAGADPAAAAAGVWPVEADARLPADGASIWHALAEEGTTSALIGLSRMIGSEARLSSLLLRQVPAAEILTALAPGDQTVAIHLGVSGAATGDIVLTYDAVVACAFADLLMAHPPGTTVDLGDIERSALSEMSNVLAGSFLNALADASSLRLMPSPPTMLIGASAGLRSLVTASSMADEHAYLSEALFHVGERAISGSFVVAPSPDLIHALQRGMVAQLARAA
jgi:chemotaxis protein CheC